MLSLIHLLCSLIVQVKVDRQSIKNNNRSKGATDEDISAIQRVIYDKYKP